MEEQLLHNPQTSNKKYYVLAAVGLVAMVACVGMLFGGPGHMPPTVITNQKTPPYVHDMFHDWKAKHGKSYETSDEHDKRLKIFHDNLKFIQAHYEGEPKTYDLGINEYSDLTWEEFRAPRITGRKFYESKYNEEQKNVVIKKEVGLPTSVDWRNNGLVTEVKNQGTCGSCWSFSAAAAIEGAYAQQGGTLTSFSEQQFIDCDTRDNNCNGGLMDSAFMFAEMNGIETLADYPYRAAFQSCKAVPSKGKVKVISITDVLRNSESQLKAHSAAHVVSVAIEADQPQFQFYSGGVFSNTCGQNLDHGVTLVGYGNEQGQDYWLVKNSWGASWGEEGYIKILRNDPAKTSTGGHCGIAKMASFPGVQVLGDYPLGFRKKFDDWKKEYKKEYLGDAQHEDKLRTFYNNYKMIHEHNKSGASYTMAINQFADLTQEEWSALYLSKVDMKKRTREPVYEKLPKVSVKDLPSSVDWRAKGAVNPIQNQASCGACWAFSAVAALEGAYFIKSGTLDKFSEQQLLDCDTVDMACNGGLMDNAFNYFEDNGPESESAYPYAGYKHSSCQAVQSKENAAAMPKGFFDVPANDATAMMQAVAQQPVSIAVEADRPAFQFYNSGVLNDPSCGTNLDHGIVAVGYGTDSGQDYWLVRNSWGTTWGDQGYIKLARGTGRYGDECGILLKASYPNV